MKINVSVNGSFIYASFKAHEGSTPLEATVVPSGTFIKDGVLYTKKAFDSNYNRVCKRLELDDLPLDEYRMGRTVHFLFEHRGLSCISRLTFDGSSRRQYIGSISTGSLYSTLPQKVYLQPESGVELFINDGDAALDKGRFESLGLIPQGIAKHVPGAQIIPQTRFRAMLDMDLVEIHKRLKSNVSRSIQYDHYYLPDLLVQFARPMKDYAVFKARLNSKYVRVKPPREVPRNGEKNAGTRKMLFRSSMDNLMMAVGVTKLYREFTPEEEYLGSRLFDDKLVPYIHTYNLYKRDAKALADEYKYSAYVDIKNFFNNVRLPLVKAALEYEGCGHLFGYFENAMADIGHLTIDSNYEHALSTLVVSYLMRDVGVIHRTFVDDILMFSNRPLDDQIDGLKKELARWGLELNESKTLRDTSLIKELVFLPVGLRYKPIEEFIENFNEVRMAGFRSVINRGPIPYVDAHSSVDTFAKAFEYDEAEWVLNNYDRINNMVLDIWYRPTEQNILEVLQHYTIRQKPFSGNEVCSLIYMMEEFPSKSKWIISILKAAGLDVETMFKNNPSEYVRYLVHGNDKYRPPSSNVVSVSSYREFKTVIEILTIQKRELSGKFIDFKSLALFNDNLELFIAYDDHYYAIYEEKPAVVTPFTLFALRNI